MTAPHRPLFPLSSVAQLSHVDSDIFRLRFFGACMKCTFCNDGCCQHGCDVNLGERNQILALKDELKPHIAIPPERWFSTTVYEDPEYPTGKYVRANTENGACVFLNRKNRGCGLHAFALAAGRDYHLLKPMVCWMFPICWDQKVLRPNRDVKDDLVCAGAGMTLYEAARDELKLVFGDGLVTELDALASVAASVDPKRKPRADPQPCAR